VTTKRKRLNRAIIASNLAEAIEQLQMLHRRATAKELNEAQLQVGLSHTYHHLNFAWNIRFVPTSEYRTLTQKQINRWGRYPTGIEDN
jgi:hypothetical protein